LLRVLWIEGDFQKDGWGSGKAFGLCGNVVMELDSGLFGFVSSDWNVVMGLDSTVRFGLVSSDWNVVMGLDSSYVWFCEF
jgi:hypothetical protein